MATDAVLAARVVTAARAWIGTPYLHQASLKGVGTDCLGLVRGVWRELHGDEPETPPPYSPWWGETGGTEPLAEAARRHLREVDLDAIGEGDVVLFRMVRSSPAKHCGIVAGMRGRPSLIHTWSGHRVAEVPFDEAWRRRLAYVFAWEV